MSKLSSEAIGELERGNFTGLDDLLRANDISIFDILQGAGSSKHHLDEAFAWACMVGRHDDAEKLLDLGADPEAGIGTGMAGAHYAASGGRLAVVEMLIRRKVALETKNMYGGTVLEQALWSAINEPNAEHAEVIEMLVGAGAHIPAGTSEWWAEQRVISEDTKSRVSAVLRSVIR
jgi:hypothetical protein